MKKENTFEDFVSGNGLLNLTLCIAVLFLMHTYTKILWLINPDGYALDAILNLVESLFFGLVTFLVIRRANNQAVKILFAVCEAVAVFLYYNSGWFGTNASWYLTSYISFLSASSVFALGYISLTSYKQKVAESNQTETETNQEIERLLRKLQDSKQEVTELQKAVTERNLLTQNSNSQVTELQNEVTKLKNEVTNKETSLLSEIESIRTAKQQIERDFSEVRANSKEWERAFLKSEIANIKRGSGWELNEEKVRMFKQYQNKLDELV